MGNLDLSGFSELPGVTDPAILQVARRSVLARLSVPVVSFVAAVTYGLTVSDPVKSIALGAMVAYTIDWGEAVVYVARHYHYWFADADDPPLHPLLLLMVRLLVGMGLVLVALWPWLVRWRAPGLTNVIALVVFPSLALGFKNTLRRWFELREQLRRLNKAEATPGV